jgi:hypothetical protein
MASPTTPLPRDRRAHLVLTTRQEFDLLTDRLELLTDRLAQLEVQVRRLESQLAPRPSLPIGQSLQWWGSIWAWVASILHRLRKRFHA